MREMLGGQLHATSVEQGATGASEACSTEGPYCFRDKSRRTSKGVSDVRGLVRVTRRRQCLSSSNDVDLGLMLPSQYG